MKKTLVQAEVRDSAAVRFAWISLFAVLTGAAAWVRIPLPFTPVPVTLQTMVVLAGGVILGRDGLYAQILYLLLGGVGLPMFASNVPNLPALFGPTGGYLIGFVLAAWGTDRWVRSGWNRFNYAGRFARLCAVSLLIFIPGVAQLALWGHLSIGQAVMLGFVPFVVGDVLKSAALSGLPKSFLR
ncbi:MAG: biotin transporter BioY [Pseudomonadota bacterium]